ncbi:phenylalanine--tRNA ligase subunit beta [Ruficoccus amylovorans]|uniref:Phenylalanine--tRNA ligase beta subunit n=1 Tax=Ruficoccus amylovorans TaxID=1804625 RepID=A0A842HBH6_9BACT|nr:phenylalanine--tRNA ligase subunit beta [Ruficoccus amylovorans]MBC2593066.1 phenylalanine--tRNA ligase subunit beta [Ruficoccus amylovorans]
MKISLNWLKNYVDLDVSAEQLANDLPMIGLEVEGVESTGLPQFENLVVGEILSREQHPDADRLGVCMVKVGDGEPQQIVCGASNYKVGDRVPVALPGCVLPGDFKIKASKLRGVPSNGMMCSAKELGMGEDHAGLLILEQRPEIGTPINDVFPGGDTVIELELTANRGDCLSHIGVAREIAALYAKELRLPKVKQHPGTGEGLISAVEVETADCPLYTARSIKGVKIAPSPEWLKKALEAVGLRPINNVVDVTNYVLMETGQPLHAFDASKIRGGKIVVRPAAEGEEITTLDGHKRKLAAGMMVIADAERPLVVAGVMGSLDAEVDASTTDIVLESAYFRPGSIRAASRALNLFSDSSHRFSRDVDPVGVDFAARRAIDLILQVAGGEVVGKSIIVGEPPRGDRTITITPDYVRRVCGFEVEDSAIAETFTRLGFTVDTSSYQWSVLVPSFRPEVDRPIDLVEEFIRLHGTADIPESRVKVTGLTREDDALAVFNRQAVQKLVGENFAECSHYTLTDGTGVAKWFGQERADALRLDNPLTTEQSHLRPSLIPGLLDALRLNFNNGNHPARLCETGRVFRTVEGKLWELASVAFVIAVDDGRRRWRDREAPDFFTAKKLVAELATLAGIKPAKLDYKVIEDEAFWQPGHSARAACWKKNGYKAFAGLVSVDALKDWDLDTLVLAGELILLPEFLEKKTGKTIRLSPFSSFPASTRDLALVVDAATTAEAVRRDLLKAASKAIGKAGFACEGVEAFDLYAGQGLPEGKKSLAFAISFRAPDRTLTDKEVNAAFDAIQAAVKDMGYTTRT